VGLPERDGLLVRDVEDGSPAARAGIQAGDLIVEAAGTPITDGDGLVEVLASAGRYLRGEGRPRNRGANRQRWWRRATGEA
jgi:S1-C subfamily serine protease